MRRDETRRDGVERKTRLSEEDQQDVGPYLTAQSAYAVQLAMNAKLVKSI